MGQSFDVNFPGLGLEFTLNRVAFTLFGMPVYWYGILIALGMLLALVFAFTNNRRFGVNSNRMVDVIVLTTICAIICGRAYYVVFSPRPYTSLWDIISIRDGGMAIYGAVLGAFFFGWLICKWRKVPVLPMFDIAAIGFLMGQGVGRWGNFVNQEAFGSNTTMPWGMLSNGTTQYLAAHQAELAAQGIVVDPAMPVHPTFFYESLWCLIGFGLLWWYSYHRKFDGEIILLYGIWYGAERAVVEGLRTDSLMWGSVRVSQILAAVLVLVCFGLWLRGRKRAKVKRAAGLPVLYAEVHPDPDKEDREQEQARREKRRASANAKTAVKNGGQQEISDGAAKPSENEEAFSDGGKKEKEDPAADERPRETENEEDV